MASESQNSGNARNGQIQRKGFDFAEGVRQPMTEIVETFEGKIQRATHHR